MRKGLLAWYSLLAAVLCADPLIAQPISPQRVSVCILTAHPEKYDGSLVVLIARVESDGREYVTLMDEHCKGEGVSLVEMHKSANTVAVEKLDDTIAKVYRGRDPHQHLTVTATIVGYFYAKPRLFLPILLPVDVSKINVHSATPLSRDPPPAKSRMR